MPAHTRWHVGLMRQFKWDSHQWNAFKMSPYGIYYKLPMTVPPSVPHCFYLIFFYIIRFYEVFFGITSKNDLKPFSCTDRRSSRAPCPWGAPYISVRHDQTYRNLSWSSPTKLFLKKNNLTFEKVFISVRVTTRWIFPLT